MRSGPNTRRLRGRGNGARRGGPPRSHNFDSNGPGIKVRGNAQQIVDKYQTLAREATIAGDRVMAENLNQHAEHYHRILIAHAAENKPDNRQDNQQDNQRDQNAELSGSDRSGDRLDTPPDTQTENRNGARLESGAEPAAGVQPTEVRTPEQNATPAVEAPAADAPDQSAAPTAVAAEETPAPKPRRTPRRRSSQRPGPVEGTSETTS